MVEKERMVILLICLTLLSPLTSANHWLLTPEGKIQLQFPPQYALRRSSDFVNFIEQENRMAELKILEQELLDYRIKLHEFQKKMGSSELRNSIDECKTAELPLSAYNLHLTSLYPMQNKRIREVDVFPKHGAPVKPGVKMGQPFCGNYSFNGSLHSYDHLSSVAGRHTLKIQPETTIVGSLRFSVDELGHLVKLELDRDFTQWVMYNWAIIYWRVKGEASEAVECARRALHYSEWGNKDVALLGLANVQHHSGHSRDATIVLEHALEISPESGVIHYMIANVYASIKEFRKASVHYQRCHEVQPSFAAAMSQYRAAMCELMIQNQLMDHSKQLDMARLKLDEFYRKHDEMQRHQLYGQVLKHDSPLSHSSFTKETKLATPSSQPSPEGDDSPVEITLYDDTKSTEDSLLDKSFKEAEKEEARRLIGENEYEAVLEDILALMEDMSSGKINKTTQVNGYLQKKKEREKLEAEQLEKEKSPAVKGERKTEKKKESGEKVGDGKDEKVEKEGKTKKSDSSTQELKSSETRKTEEKITVDQKEDDKKELEDKNNVIDKEEKLSEKEEETIDTKEEVATDTTQPSSAVAESASDKRVSEGTSASLPHHSSSPTISGGFASQDSCTSEACTARNETRSSNGSQHPPRIKIISNKNTKRGEERRRNNSEETTSPPAPSPSQLDEGLFPVINNEPILAVHDPTWPGVSECLVFERELVSWKKTTSTMIDPGKREVNYNEPFKMLAERTPAADRMKPYCEDIVDMPFSSLAMDHLDGLLWRHNFTDLNKEQLAENEDTLIDIVYDAADRGKHRFPLDTVAEIIYRAMLKRGPSWLLLNIAGVYWRIVGDAYNALECFRRAAQVGPRVQRDIPYVGMANVLTKLGHLDDAAILTRAALDIHFDEPVTHYTMAIILIGLHERDLASLHLKFAVVLDPNLSIARELLKALLCIGILNKEAEELEKEIKRLQEQAILLDGKLENELQSLNKEKIKYAHILRTVEGRKTRLTPKDQADGTSQVIGEEKTPSSLVGLLEVMKKDFVLGVQRYYRLKHYEAPYKRIRKEAFDSIDPLARDGGMTGAEIRLIEWTMGESLARREHGPIDMHYWLSNWPKVEECIDLFPMDPMPLVSTALLPNKKGVHFTESAPYQILTMKTVDITLQPFCKEVKEAEFTLKDLIGVKKVFPEYKPEPALIEPFLESFLPMKPTLEEAGAKLKLGLDHNATSWVLNALAATYWRIVGDGEMALKCTIRALSHTPVKHKDVANQALASIFVRSGLYNNATSLLRESLKISPKKYELHYTMAITMYLKDMLPECSAYLENTLQLRFDFTPALVGLRTVKCMIVLRKEDIDIQFRNK